MSSCPGRRSWRGSNARRRGPGSSWPAWKASSLCSEAWRIFCRHLHTKALLSRSFPFPHFTKNLSARSFFFRAVFLPSSQLISLEGEAKERRRPLRMTQVETALLLLLPLVLMSSNE